MTGSFSTNQLHRAEGRFRFPRPFLLPVLTSAAAFPSDVVDAPSVGSAGLAPSISSCSPLKNASVSSPISLSMSTSSPSPSSSLSSAYGLCCGSSLLSVSLSPKTGSSSSSSSSSSPSSSSSFCSSSSSISSPSPTPGCPETTRSPSPLAKCRNRSLLNPFAACIAASCSATARAAPAAAACAAEVDPGCC